MLEMFQGALQRRTMCRPSLQCYLLCCEATLVICQFQAEWQAMAWNDQWLISEPHKVLFEIGD